ncbi:MAG: DEAD/DEAH box helicase [Micrococcales bacterium]|nr:DEAD/DEAH box helicase [Micrococcales bacterium]
MTKSGLEHFSPATRAWFQAAFEAPTAAQVGAWDAIAAGHHALVVAPTGSGKTLAAFLSAIDHLMTSPPPAERQARCRVVYVSPLKALATDVERNLRAPLTGVSNQLAAAGRPVPEVAVGLRTGDTPTSERRKFATKPPDVLITTPESLFLVLTSGARAGLAGVETVIIDEIHALAATKRGAHLALSLERLDALLATPAQRVALSATVKPVAEVARFIRGAAERPADQPRPLDFGAGDGDGVATGTGTSAKTPDQEAQARPPTDPPIKDAKARPPPRPPGREVVIVQPPANKVIDIEVRLPVEDLADLAANTLPEVIEGDLTGDAAGAMRGASIWPHVHQAVLDEIESHRSTLVFANARRGAERLAARLNEEHYQQVTGETPRTTALTHTEQHAQANSVASLEATVALAHHGSMSRERRTEIENQLKAGLLPAVVATSSLELGIDMGAIDLVIQVGAPPSVASAMQRIGRAGHQVGAVSHGVMYPLFLGDLVPAAVVAGRMVAGQIESISLPQNPLDVLAQQIVAAVAMDNWQLGDLLDLVRGAANFEHLGQLTYEAVLDMLAGRYPSADFGELRPRLVWDRATGELSPRPGAAHLAQVSGGTIPDRGMYGVFLAGENPASKGAKRVGELDEEMVYESRVGDTFTLGSSTWRIMQITPNAVYVLPAPGIPGRLPFWRGDGPGRPAELGASIGQFVRQTHAAGPGAVGDLRALGLDASAAANLIAHLDDQAQATGQLPDDQTLVFETFLDELGDRRVMIHSVWGGQVNGAWAAVLAQRLQQRYGLDAQVMHNDDGIMLRLPETVEDEAATPVGDLLLDPDQVSAQVTEAISSTAHFAARFREAAARSLTLPRRAGKRQPLWQQRHRAHQLLQVAAKFDDFPIVLEAVRECLQDDFDVPALERLMRAVDDRSVRVVEVQTDTASPFAKSMTFGYTAQFLYDGDAPLAERRAAALSLDPNLLAELLGRGEASDPADLLDADVILALDGELAYRSDDRRLSTAEGLVDLLRGLGPQDSDQLEAACEGSWSAWITSLVAERRVIEVRIGAHQRWAVVEDAAALRDGLGVALPAGLAEAFLEPVSDPLGGLLRRYLRHHGPFTAAQVASEFGLGLAVAERELEALVRAGKAVAGRLRPVEAGGGGGRDYCDPEIMARARRRSLAVLRRQVEPVQGPALAQFAAVWHKLGRLRGADGVLQAINTLAGAPLPASSIETVVLTARVTDYEPAMLDELITSGEVAWVGQGKTTGTDGTIRLLATSTDDAYLADVEPAEDPTAQALLGLLGHGGAFTAHELARRLEIDSNQLRSVLWDLVWGGWLTGDSFAPVRAFLAGGKTAHRTKRRPRSRTLLTRRALGQAAQGASSSLEPAHLGDPRLVGRWSLAPTPAGQSLAITAEEGLAATATSLLERHGVLTRGAVKLETSFAQLYPVLAAMEQAGSVRRGYFVEHLGGSQFALPPCPDQLRASAESGGVIIVASADPANPYGAALPWTEAAGGHRPSRTAGALVVLVDGQLSLYLERGGKTALSFGQAETVSKAALALVQAVKAGRLPTLKVARLDGEDALAAYAERQDSVLALVHAGFAVTPAGLTLRSGRA